MKNKLIYWLLKQLGYRQQIGTDWKPGYVRYFTILSYPKEGWINTFHNYDNEKQLKEDIEWTFAQSVWGGMLPKGSPQIVIDKKGRKLKYEES